jgi:xanthine/uracil permease
MLKAAGTIKMIKLDSQFAQLRTAPLPDGLAVIELRVLTGIARQREAAISRRGLVLAGAVSLVIGLFTSLVPVQEARAEPLFGVPAAAPSRLLGL